MGGANQNFDFCVLSFCCCRLLSENHFFFKDIIDVKKEVFPVIIRDIEN